MVMLYKCDSKEPVKPVYNDSLERVNIQFDSIEDRYAANEMKLWEDITQLQGELAVAKARYKIKEVYYTTSDTIVLRECCVSLIQCDSAVRKGDKLIQAYDTALKSCKEAKINLSNQVEFNRTYAKAVISERDKTGQILSKEKKTNKKLKKQRNILGVIAVALTGLVLIK
jgi:hypothetical protein